MFGQLGRLVWAPFSFLWSYVTMPTLLALLTIYFLNLYHSESLYYITWNDSVVCLLPMGTLNPKHIDSGPHPVPPTHQGLGEPCRQSTHTEPSPCIFSPRGPGDTVPRLSPYPCGPLSLFPESRSEATLPEDDPGLGHLPQHPGPAAYSRVPTPALVVPG